MFNLVDDLTRPEMMLHGFGHFVAHCESYAQDIENAALVTRVWSKKFLRERRNCTAALCIFP